MSTFVIQIATSFIINLERKKHSMLLVFLKTNIFLIVFDFNQSLFALYFREGGKGQVENMNTRPPVKAKPKPAREALSSQFVCRYAVHCHALLCNSIFALTYIN